MTLEAKLVLRVSTSNREWSPWVAKGCGRMRPIEFDLDVQHESLRDMWLLILEEKNDTVRLKGTRLTIGSFWGSCPC